MRRLLLLAMLPAACSKPTGTETKVAAADVAAEAGKLKLQPGEWETTTLITDLAVPGVPPEAMKAATGTRTTTRNCVTPAEAARPGAQMFSGSAGADCSYRRFSVSGARIDAAMTCAPAAAVPGAGRVDLTVAGGHSPAAFDVGLAMKTDLPDGRAMTMKARVTGKRTGDCATTELNA